VTSTSRRPAGSAGPPAPTDRAAPALPPPAVRRAQLGHPLDEALAPRTGGAASIPRTRGRPAPTLTEQQREQVVDTVLALVEGIYAHLPLKRARYAIDPVQRLRLLRRQAAVLPDEDLLGELSAVLTGLRDAHTRFIGPADREGVAARLPFLVEAWGEPPNRHHVASKVVGHLVDDSHFEEGVELLWWNAVPIERAVDNHGRDETGGRPDSRRARALESMTLRALRYGPPPDEHWVVVGYRDLSGTVRETRFDWRVVRPGRARTAGEVADRPARAYAVDPAAETTRRVKKMLFAAEQWQADRRPAARRRHASTGATGWLETPFGDTVAARAIDTPSGRFGLLRLWSFDLADDRAYVEEVVRLLGLLPQDGLIVDARANPGGLVWAAERLLQLFTPRPVVPTRFSLLATAVTRELAHAPQNEQELDAWRASLDDAIATGEAYSLAAPLTPLARCNDLGQAYGGPVVAVADAGTYSAGDLFAAGFVDNDLGVLVTVGEATGAGGANLWTEEDLTDALLGTRYELGPLPAGISYTLAVRRATRGGPSDGMTIEDVGVRGHHTYAMTKDDLIDNRDLYAHCGRILAGLPRTALRVEPGATPEELLVTTGGLDRLDVYADGRPWRSLPVGDGTGAVPVPADRTEVAIEGWAAGELRQRRRSR
jgi:Peptidase family S41